MKMNKRVLSFVMFAVLLFTMAISTFAMTDNGITPYYNNASATSETFGIDENGLATVSFTCRGIRGTTTKIVVDTKIEKQNGSSWIEVDNASWTDQSTLYICSNEHEIQLTERGTYKATITYTVSGSGGTDDVITREIQKTY